MIMSSLAGCIGDTEDEAVVVDDTSTAPLGTVIASTYHVQQLLSAVAGDTLNVELLSPSNVPVHDYSPTPEDVLRLQGADVFFYHGLGLEPWVEATLTGLSTAAPTSISTHAMPTGEVTLDYESILISELCEHISEGPFQNTTLGMDDSSMPEIHAEHVTYSMSYPHMEDEHHEDEEHDENHSEEHGEEHDDHAGHDHASPMETITNPSGCPTDYVIVIYELEKGDVVIEFEAEDDDAFDMVVLKMGGGHAHHHHGHGDGPFEWAGIFEINDATHTWTMEKVGGSYADPIMRVVLIPTDTPTEETMHSLEDGVEALIEGECTVVEDGESMTPVAGGSCFEWHVGTGNISSFTINTAGISGLAAYTAHSPYEFEATQHYLKDSAGNDVEHVAEEGGGGHGDHGDGHGDHGDGHGDHGDGHGDHSDHEDQTPEEVMAMFDSNNDSLLSLEEFMQGMESMEDDHDDHEHHNSNYYDGCDESTDPNDGHYECWMNEWLDDDGDTNITNGYDEDECTELSNLTWECERHDPIEEAIEEYMMDLYQNAFNESDMYYYNGGNNDAGDGFLNMTEFEELIKKLEHIDEDIESSHSQIIISAFDEDGDGSFNMTEFAAFIEATDNDHDDHGDHNESHENNSVIMVCYDWATGTMNVSYNNQADCVAAGSTFQWMDMESAIMEMMFNMYDNNSNGVINASELGMMMNMGDDNHGDHHDHWEPGTCHDTSTHETHEEYTDEEDCEAAGHLWMGDEHHGEEHGVRGIANLHVEAEGEYGFLLPADVTMYVLSGGEGHADHGDHGGHDDHSDEDGDHDDHSDEDGDHDDHDDHAEEEIPFDPHSWLDPIAFKAQIDVVLTALIAEFPSAEEDFTANANAYKLELDTIALGFENAFGESGTCAADKTFAANHNAYSYLAQRYDLEFVTVHGLDPEGEPSAEDIAEVVAKIQEEEITVFYVEEYTDISSVDSIVSETGVTILYLYTMEMPPSTPGEDYLSLMQKNLDNLVTGIGC